MPLACFGRSKTSSSDQGASIVTTSQPSQQQLQLEAHRWIDSIARNYNKLPRDLPASYRERAQVVSKDADQLIRETSSSEINDKLRCHAREMESLRQGKPKEWTESNRMGAWREAPRNSLALQWAFLQLEGVWPLAPIEAKEQMSLGFGIKDADPESVFRMRPVYERLVASYREDCNRLGKEVMWLT